MRRVNGLLHLSVREKQIRVGQSEPTACSVPHVAKGTCRSRQSGKMLVALLGVLAVLAMGVAAFAIVLQTQERDKRQAKERELELATAENGELKAQFEELQQAKTHIDEELTRTRKELSQLQQEIAKSVETQQTLSRSVEDREKEIGRLTKDLEQVRNDAKQNTSQFSDLQKERDVMRKQLADLEKAKSDLEAKVMELSGRPTVELDKVVVGDTPRGAVSGGAAARPVSATATAAVIPSSASLGAAGGSSDGQVVVINREYDFIVMNLGKNHGLSVGQEFQIVRGNAILGKVRVEKVYDELSAAAILPNSQKDSIREGDAVRAL